MSAGAKTTTFKTRSSLVSSRYTSPTSTDSLHGSSLLISSFRHDRLGHLLRHSLWPDADCHARPRPRHLRLPPPKRIQHELRSERLGAPSEVSGCRQPDLRWHVLAREGFVGGGTLLSPTSLSPLTRADHCRSVIGPYASTSLMATRSLPRPQARSFRIRRRPTKARRSSLRDSTQRPCGRRGRRCRFGVARGRRSTRLERSIDMPLKERTRLCGKCSVEISGRQGPSREARKGGWAGGESSEIVVATESSPGLDFGGIVTRRRRPSATPGNRLAQIVGRACASARESWSGQASGRAVSRPAARLRRRAQKCCESTLLMLGHGTAEGPFLCCQLELPRCRDAGRRG